LLLLVPFAFDGSVIGVSINLNLNPCKFCRQKNNPGFVETRRRQTQSTTKNLFIAKAILLNHDQQEQQLALRLEVRCLFQCCRPSSRPCRGCERVIVLVDQKWRHAAHQGMLSSATFSRNTTLLTAVLRLQGWQ